MQEHNVTYDDRNAQRALLRQRTLANRHLAFLLLDPESPSQLTYLLTEFYELVAADFVQAYLGS